MKKIILFSSTFIIVFIIYYFNVEKNVDYLYIGDYLTAGLYKYEDNYGYKTYKNLYKSNKVKTHFYSSDKDYRIIDLSNDIKYNNKRIINGKEYTINNLLIKADIIILSIGSNDIYYQRNIEENKILDYMDSILKNLETLFKTIRKYSKEDIYIFNYYNLIENRSAIKYMNKKLLSIVKDYNIKVIDISDVDRYIFDKSIYPDKVGYNYIYNQIETNLQKYKNNV